MIMIVVVVVVIVVIVVVVVVVVVAAVAAAAATTITFLVLHCQSVRALPSSLIAGAHNCNCTARSALPLCVGPVDEVEIPIR